MTGSTVFDFDGDGACEVVYSDEMYLRIYGGADGEVLFEQFIGSGTATELPIIADVDNDNNAEIVVVGNTFHHGGETGIIVYGDANDTWVNTRKIWNQHAYHVTNVNDDGTVPQKEDHSWLTHNTYRCNVSEQALACVDISASYLRVDNTQCSDSSAIIARIGNGGALHVWQDIKVAFFRGDPAVGGTLLGVAELDQRIDPGRYADVSFTLLGPSSGQQMIYVVADNDGTGHGVLREKDEANNSASAMLDFCNHPPLFGPISDVIITEREVFEHTVTVTDSDGDSLHFSLVEHPAGMTIDPATGVIFWQSDVGDAGEHNVIVAAADGRGGMAHESFNLTVNYYVNQSPVFTSTPITDATQGRQYAYKATASDGNEDSLLFLLGAFPFCGPYSSIFESWVGTVARRYRSSHRPAL